MTRTQLRTIVHTQKQHGRVRIEGDGYVWKAAPDSEAAPSVQEDAAL